MIESYQRNQRTLFSTVGDDIVALNVEDGFCYGMEGVAAVVWTLLEHPVDLDTMCARLVEQFEVDPEVCHAEVRAFLERLREQGLIDEMTDAPPSPENALR